MSRYISGRFITVFCTDVNAPDFNRRVWQGDKDLVDIRCANDILILPLPKELLKIL